MIVAMPMPPPMHSVISAVALFATLELVERGAEQDRAGRAERVAERDRAAVDVDPLAVDAEVARGLQRHAANASLISHEVDVADLHAGALRAPSPRPARRRQHDHRLGAGGRHRADLRARLEAGASCRTRPSPSSTAAAPSTMPDELPAGVHVLDRLGAG